MKHKLYFMFSLVMILCLLGLPGLTASAHDLPQWTQVNVVPPNETMANVTTLTAFNGNLYAGTTRWADVDLANIDSAVYQSKDGRNWKRVTEYGFGDPLHNTSIFKMTVFQNKLYVGTGDLFGTGPAQLYRTGNGIDWQAVDTNGFGDPNNNILGYLFIFRGMLYAAEQNTGIGMQLYRSPTGNPGSWKKATTDFDDPKYASQGATGFIVFNDMLYMTTEVAEVGLWRSKDGTHWTQITSDGFGGQGDGIGGMTIFNSQLYLGMGNEVDGGQIWRSRDGKNWSKVIDGGFGDANNFKLSALIPYGGYLYVFTANFVTGVEAWRSPDGKQWEQVNQDGFRPGCLIGDQEDCNWSATNGPSVLIFRDHLHVGVWNPYGGEVWKLDGDR